MVKAKGKYTTLLEISRIPSPTGQFEVVFTIVATDDGEKFLSISKMAGTRPFTGMLVPLEVEAMKTLAETFGNIHEALLVMGNANDAVEVAI